VSANTTNQLTVILPAGVTSIGSMLAQGGSAVKVGCGMGRRSRRSSS